MYDDWYDTFSLIVVLVVLIIAVIIFPTIVIIRSIYKGNKNNWEITTARLTGKQDSYMETVARDGFYRTPRRTTECQIEYVVGGKKYLKYVSSTKTGGRKRGKVRIKYLKRRPSIFRVL